MSGKEPKVSLTKTIIRDIIVMSAQAVAFRLGAPPNEQKDVFFTAVPVRDNVKVLDDNSPQARRIGFQ
jgi:hypothetical protein